MRTIRSTTVVAAALLSTVGSVVSVGAQDEGGPVFHTTAGPLTKDMVGDVLAHHHIFVELGAVPPVAYLDADPEMVNEVIGPWLEEAKALEFGTFIEFTPEGVGRRPDIVKYVADQAGLPTMLVTGIYREPFMPDWAYTASVDEVVDFLRTELTEGVTDTGVPAGFIKLSQNDTGMTLTERKILQAACIAAQETGSAIASHITSGPAALSVMDALASFGCPQDEVRFVWVHAMLTAASEGAALGRRSCRGRRGHRVPGGSLGARCLRQPRWHRQRLLDGLLRRLRPEHRLNLPVRRCRLRGPDHHRVRHGLVRPGPAGGLRGRTGRRRVDQRG